MLGLATTALAFAGCGGDDDDDVDAAGGNQAPTATFTMSPDCTASAADPVTFTSTSTDPDGDTLSCMWTFGSGTPANGNTCEVTGVTFPNIQPYNVTLMIDDGNGGTDSLQMSISPCT